MDGHHLEPGYNLSYALMDDLLRCRDWIEAALEYSAGTHSFKDIVDGVLSGKFKLWSNDRACVVTHLIDSPQKLILHFFLAGGDLSAVRELEDLAIKWGEDNHCDSATLIGRKGWAKALRDNGWEDSHIMMIRSLK